MKNTILLILSLILALLASFVYFRTKSHPLPQPDIQTQLAKKISDSEHVTISDLYFLPLVLDWNTKFFNNPAVLTAILNNPQDYPAWLANTPHTYQLPTHSEPEITGISSTQTTLAKQILETYVPSDRFRVGHISIGSSNSTTGSNLITWQESQSPSNMEIVRALIHELTHATTPLHSLVAQSDKDTKFTLLGYGYKKTLAFYTDWLKVINNNYPYFQSRFFHAKGDGTLSLAAQSGQGFPRMLDEFIAMLCTDYVLPSPLTPPPPLPPQVETQIKVTLGYVFHGISGGNVTTTDLSSVRSGLKKLVVPSGGIEPPSYP
jgi:hypothetical protein